jgi:glycosyltransferase involved in cell wall biosynthesis
MKVTVITPLYNAEAYVAETVRSVLKQTHPDVEHVVVDDGSTDRSAALVAAMAASHPQIRLIRQDNRGVAAARNRGAQEARPDSTYLLFLDADDVLVPEALATLAAYLDARPGAAVVFSATAKIDADGHSLGETARVIASTRSALRVAPSRFGVRFLPDAEARTPLTAILSGYHGFIPSSALIRRSVFDDTPGFDEDFGQPWEDNDLFVHLALRGDAYYLPERLVHYRQHERQSTADDALNRAQEQKFRQKWLRLDALDLSVPQRKALADALHFLHYRYASWGGMQAFRRHLAQGELLSAVRFLGGALLRYPWSVTRDYTTTPTISCP